MASLDSVRNALTKQPIQIRAVEKGIAGIAESETILNISATISENYSMSASVTTYPVEDGANLAEHSMVNSSTISISCVTSDASMSYFDALDSLSSSFVGQLVGAQSNSQRVYDTLMRWMNNSTPLFLKTHFAKSGYRNRAGTETPFIIESLSIPRDKSTGKAIRFDMTLRQIQFVTINRELVAGTNLGDQVLTTGVKTDTAEVNNAETLQRQEQRLLENNPAKARLGF